MEKTKAYVRFALIEEHFYGNPLKRIKGACAQLIDGEGAFSALYNITEGEYTRELVLKASCFRKDTSSSYVAGVHFTVNNLITFGVNKKVKGHQLWAMGLTVLRSIRKALAMVPKLSPLIILIDKNCTVLSYASDKNKSLFMKYIDDGMYALMMSKGEADVVDGGSLDDNNVILGATSAEGMSLMRDDVLIEHVREKTVEGLPLRPGSPWQGQVVEDLDSTEVAQEEMNPTEVDGKLDKNNFDDVDVDLAATSTWDPFGGVVALGGFVYIRKLSIYCFGPTLKNFAGTLEMGRQSNQSVEEKKVDQCRCNVGSTPSRLILTGR